MRKSSFHVCAQLLGLVILAGSLFAQPKFEDTLFVGLETEGEKLTARVFLDTQEPGIQGVSFALCHATVDTVLDSTAEGTDILTANGGEPADFIAIRSGESNGIGFVTFAAAIDFDESLVFSPGAHELLVLAYAIQPGGGGRSLRFCKAGNPVVETRVVRADRTVSPRTLISDESVNTVRVEDAEGVRGASITVPIYLSTDRPGLTGATFVLCHDSPVLSISGVDSVRPSPELLSFGPSFQSGGATGLVCDGDLQCVLETSVYDELTGGLRVSLTLESALPRVTDFPVLLATYSVRASEGGNTQIRSCEVGVDTVCERDIFSPPCSDTEDTVTALRFGDQTLLPRTEEGSVVVVADHPRPTYALDPLTAADQDPIEVNVGMFQPTMPQEVYKAFSMTVSFDPDLFQVLEEPSVEDHRGSGLSQLIGIVGEPVSEDRFYRDSSFTYRIDFGTCGQNAGLLFQPVSFAKFRLVRKDIPLPGGVLGKVAGGPIPLRFVGLNQHQVTTVFFCWVHPPESPKLRNGSLTIGPDLGIRFRASSADVEVFEPAEVTIFMDAEAEGIQALTYTVTHDPSVLSLAEVESTPALLALNPESSIFELREESFTHTIVFGALDPLGAVENLSLATVRYEPLGIAGESSALEFSTEGDTRTIVAVSRGAEVRGVLPSTITAGRVRLKEDAAAVAYHVSGGRQPPGSEIVVSVSVDAAAGGIPGFQGALCHDATVASAAPGFFGESAAHLGTALEAVRDGLPPSSHSLKPGRGPGGEHGVIFHAVIDEENRFRLPAGSDLEVFRVGYELTGRYGDVLALTFCELSPGSEFNPDEPLTRNETVTNDGRAVPVRRLSGSRILLTDELARTVSPAVTPGAVRAVAVTEFGWRWGVAPDSLTVQHYDHDGQPFGQAIMLADPPRRIANGGEGWAWASLPGRIAILRFDQMERDVVLDGEPYGIAVDRERNAWVAVAGRENRLLKVDRAGRTLRRVTLRLPEGAEPRDILIDEEGAVWLSHEGVDFLSRIASNGTPISLEATRLRFSRPSGLATDGRGTLWIGDAGDRSLLAFDLAGREKRRIALEAEPTSVSLDGSGNLWTVLRGLDGEEQLVRIDRPCCGTSLLLTWGPDRTWAASRQEGRRYTHPRVKPATHELHLQREQRGQRRRRGVREAELAAHRPVDLQRKSHHRNRWRHSFRG